MLQENSEVKQMYDKVSPIIKILKLIGYVTGVVLLIAGTLKTSDENSALPLVIYTSAGIIASILFFALAIVIELLFKIYESLTEG